jgi:hypothetical protein
MQPPWTRGEFCPVTERPGSGVSKTMSKLESRHLRRHQPVGIYCEYCNCEIGVAEFVGEDQVVSVRCGCRWSIIQKSDLPSRYQEWEEFWKVWHPEKS